MTSPGSLDGEVAIALPEAPGEIACAIAPIGDYTATLTRAEADLVAKAPASRRFEFSTGRRLAHRLLHASGLDAGEILSGGRREPLWPEGVVGSITHADTYAAAAIAARSTITGIGIDIEKRARVGPKIVHKLLTPNERRRYPNLDPTLVFSAKEACYKFVFPLVGELVDYLDVEVDMHPSLTRFDLRYIGPSTDNAIIETARGDILNVPGHWLTCVTCAA